LLNCPFCRKCYVICRHLKCMVGACRFQLISTAVPTDPLITFICLCHLYCCISATISFSCA